MIVGIDFGTCFSSAAIMNGLIPVTNYIKDTTNGLGIPSLFMYHKELGKELYGEDCIGGESYRFESDIVRYMKRSIRENSDSIESRIMSGGREYILGEAVESYLSYLIDRIKKAGIDSGELENNELEAVTITAPVGIASGQMMATEYNKFLQETVMKITGLDKENVRVIQEPVAAAISYLYSEDTHKHYDDSQTILVFDLGGGTLDVSIVEHDPVSMTYEIKAKEGDLNLGGNDWDAELCRAVMKKLKLKSKGTDEEAAKIDRMITKLKIDLTTSDESVVFMKVNGKDEFAKFTRDEFDACTESLLNRAMDIVGKAVDDYGDDIDKIVLVGGSSNMPQIRKRLVLEYGHIGEENILLYEPSKAIAKGAAVYAKSQFSDGSVTAGPVIKDCTLCTYGFESHKDSIKSMIYNMIYKDTPFDESNKIVIRSNSDFVPLSDNQTKVSFDIYESSAKRGNGIDGDWMDFGNGESPNGLSVTVNVPPQYYGQATKFAMWVDLAVDSNGILEITIVDKMGRKLGYASSCSIKSE